MPLTVDQLFCVSDIVDSATWLSHLNKLHVHIHERRAISSAASRGLWRLDPSNKIRPRERQRDVRVSGNVIHRMNNGLINSVHFNEYHPTFTRTVTTFWLLALPFSFLLHLPAILFTSAPDETDNSLSLCFRIRVFFSAAYYRRYNVLRGSRQRDKDESFYYNVRINISTLNIRFDNMLYESWNIDDRWFTYWM